MTHYLTSGFPGDVEKMLFIFFFQRPASAVIYKGGLNSRLSHSAFSNQSLSFDFCLDFERCLLALIFP